MQQTYSYNLDDTRSRNQLIGKIYGYMFFGLLLTAVIAFGLGILFNIWIFGRIDISNVDYADISGNLNISGARTLLAVLVVSSVALLITSFVVHIVFLRGRHSLRIPALVYCVLMGVVLSSLVVFVPWPVLGITFAITSGIFGIMYLISYISKGSLNFLGVIGLGLLLGAALLSLIGWILAITGALGAYMHLYWIISLMSFAAIMFITIWDMWRIKQIAQQGEASENIVLYCAFNLYVDFIYLFLQVLRIVSYFYSRK